MSDTYDGPRTKPPGAVQTAHYDYHDANGKVLFRKCRYTPKSFRLCRLDPTVPNKLIWDLKGIEVPLYHLPILLSRPHETVYLAEGERDADWLLAAGLLATTAPFGSKAPWQPQWLKPLEGRNVVALPDSDADGETYVLNFGLAAKPASYKVLHLPGLEMDSGEDVYDWFTRHKGNADWLAQLAVMTPEWSKPLETQEEVAASLLMAMNFPVVEWTAEGIVPTRSLSIWGGRPKAGKSSLLLWLAKCICGGTKFLNTTTRQGKVLLVCLEDSPRRVKHRIEAQGWTPDEIANLTLRFNFPQYHDGGARKIESLARKGYALIGIDTLGRFAPRLDLMNYQDVSAALSHLSLLADRSATPIILPHHTRKGQPGIVTAADPVADLLGSVALAGSADVAAVLYRDRTKPHATFAVTGRDIEERDINILGSPGHFTWQTTEVVQGVTRDSLKARVLEAIEELGGKATLGEIASFLNLTTGGLQQTINGMRSQGLVIQQARRHPYQLPGTKPETPLLDM